ncbi:MAG: hypothetical protein EBY20_07800 [Alphaproteobacteria bacterium]|nr:hypothetical protein [Alphaproteobacteria bacterium]
MDPLIAPAAATAAESLLPTLIRLLGPQVAAQYLVSKMTGGGDEAKQKDFNFEPLVSQVAGGVISATAPSSNSPVAVQPNSGNYFLGSAPFLRYETNYRNEENKNRAVLRRLFNIKYDDLPNVDTTAEFMQDIEQTQQRQAEQLNLRQIQELKARGMQERMLAQLKADKEFKRIEMEKGADLARTGLERGFSLEEVKQKAIGDIEKQKYSSAYDAAKTLLNSTIDAISGPGPYANNPDLRQVATPV